MFSLIQKNSFFAKKAPLLASLLLGFSCLVFLQYYPAQEGFQEISKAFFFLVLTPATFIKFILGKNLSDFGLNLKKTFSGVIWSSIFLFLILGATYWFFNFSKTEIDHQLPNYIFESFPAFLFYQLVFLNLTIFIQDFFFGGFLLFSLAKDFGAWSVLISTLTYFSFSAFSSGFSETAILLSLMLFLKGLIIFRTGSFIYTYLATLIFSFVSDAYIIYLFK